MLRKLPNSVSRPEAFQAPNPFGIVSCNDSRKIATSKIANHDEPLRGHEVVGTDLQGELANLPLQVATLVLPALFEFADMLFFV